MSFQPNIQQMAERKVRAKSKFYKHLFFYLVVNGFLFFHTLFDGEPFATMPLIFFWGVGLVFHYLKVFGVPGSGVLSQDWEEKEYKKELERLERRQKVVVPREEEKLELKEMSKNYRESDLV